MYDYDEYYELWIKNKKHGEFKLASHGTYEDVVTELKSSIAWTSDGEACYWKICKSNDYQWKKWY